MDTELLVERLVQRIDKANIYFLMEIGKYIKEIGELSPTKAQQLIQVLKYGGRYEDIVRQISKYTNLDIEEIDRIFENYAKKDQLFYKKFYEYRNIPFVEYEQNEALVRQTKALANITKQTMMNFTRSRALGYTLKDIDGTIRFYGLRETYERVLDEALLNVGQGKETFDMAMKNILNDLGGSGLKTLDYESGRSIRLDSMVTMHLQDGLRNLHNENQMLFGEEFGANMVEVSHHMNSAPDHIDTIDGKQFALIDKIKEQIKKGIETKIKLSDIDGNRVRVNGKWYDDFNYVNGKLERPVSTYNCRHYIFYGILGVTKPEFTQEQLDKDKEKNLKGFDYNGKHYSMYEGTQLQRKLERSIRKQKDIQILGKSTNNKELIGDAQKKITILSKQYKELSDISGLPTKMARLRVSGYKRSKI